MLGGDDGLGRVHLTMAVVPGSGPEPRHIHGLAGNTMEEGAAMIDWTYAAPCVIILAGERGATDCEEDWPWCTWMANG